ncbi:MAG: DPP IV N-terminal domain-containing protein [Ignavibacteriae bacterium]|nr:DPP IV N-terminal domain-containing protein [Ignavibacteriota bacterium]
MKLVTKMLFATFIMVHGFLITNAQTEESLTVERLFQKPRLEGVVVSGIAWSPDGKKVTYLRADASSDIKELWWFDVSTRRTSLLISAKDIVRGEQKFSEEEVMLRERTRQTDAGITKYIWSPDGKVIYVPLNDDIYSLNVASGVVAQLTNTEKSEFDPKISPTGRYLSFVRENEIYVLELKSRSETRLTTGATEKIKNGISEYIAQEEMGRTTGYWWSPTGTHIAYLQIDNTPVKEFNIPDYLGGYTNIHAQEYAKAGESNTLVRVGVVPVAGGVTTWMNLGANSDIYVPRVHWMPGGKRLAVQVQSRNQDTLDLMVCDIAEGASSLLLREIDPKWVRLHDDLRFLDSRRQFTWASERDGFKHLYLYDKSGNLVNQITRGEWEVEKVAGVDEKNGIVYFTAAEKSPIERHMYKVSLDGSGFKRISTSDGWHEITMSQDCRSYIDMYSNVSRLPLLSYMTVNQSTAALVEENPQTELRKFSLPKPEFFTVNSSNGDVDLHAFIIKPSTFDETKKYPVIVYVYGGPTSQIVANRWGAGGGASRALWHRLMAERGYIVFGVDGRGTPSRGREFLNHIHKRLGDYELRDQLSGVQYLTSLPYVDVSRIMIWGKSYGGFMTCMAMFTAGDAFKLGISVAPVTDWKNYDTHYTERYLERPQENPDGYRLSSPVSFATGLKKKLLIIHGVVDDNVHFQDSMVLAQELQKANKQFDFMPYPKSTHSFGGDAVGTHLYNLLVRYIQDHL